MQTSAPHSYAHLKEQLNAWKGRVASQPNDRPPDQEFDRLAQEVLLPELKKLAVIITEADLDCEILAGNDEDVTIGVHIESLHTTLRLSPAENPTFIRAAIARGDRPNDQLEWFIPCHVLRTGGLERELQAAIVRTLRPVRSL